MHEHNILNNKTIGFGLVGRSLDNQLRLIRLNFCFVMHKEKMYSMDDDVNTMLD